MNAPNVRDVRGHLPHHRRDDSAARGLVLFGLALLGYVVCFLGTAAAPWWPLQLLGCVPVGFFVTWLFLIGHEAAHGSLLPWRPLNDWLGRLAFLPSLTPFSAWVADHRRHHGFTNLRSFDATWAPLTKEEFDRLPFWERALQRSYRTVLGVALYAVVELWWKAMMVPPAALRGRRSRVELLDRLVLLAGLAAQVGGLLAWRAWLAGNGLELTPLPVAVAACVAVPFLELMWWLGMVGFLQHTHPRVRWYDDRREWSFFRGQVAATVHVVVPRPVGWLMGNILEHTAHHVDPAVPLTALPECQGRLEERFPQVVVHRLTLKSCLRVLSACQLYDYRRHRWLDFDGRETPSELTP